MDKEEREKQVENLMRCIIKVMEFDHAIIRDDPEFLAVIRKKAEDAVDMDRTDSGVLYKVMHDGHEWIFHTLDEVIAHLIEVNDGRIVDDLTIFTQTYWLKIR